MKKFYMPLLCGLLALGTSYGQEVSFSGQKIAKKSADLKVDIKQYDAYNLDLSKIHDYAKSKKDNPLSFKLELGKEHSWHFNVFAKDIRSANYKLRVSDADGVKEVSRSATTTYQGFLENDPNISVRMSIADGYLSAFLLDADGKQTFLQMAPSRKKGAPVVMVYAGVDGIKEINCKYHGVEMEVADLPKKAPQGTCEVAEIALMADHSAVATMGGGTAAATETKFLDYMNTVDLLYDTHFVDYIVSEFFISVDKATEPWSQISEPIFKSGVINRWADENFTEPNDVVTFWTDLPTGFAYSTGKICNPKFGRDPAFPEDSIVGGNVCPTWGGLANDAWNINIQAHEVGHNWGQGHVGGDYIMNPAPPHSSSGSRWTTETINVIANFKAGIDCLDPCSAREPVAKFSADNTNVCIGTTVNFSDKSDNSPTTWSWTFEGGTPATSTDENPSITYDAEGIYLVTLKVENEAGSDSTATVGYITVKSTGGSLPMEEEFDGDFPPMGWTIINPDNGLAFQKSTAAGYQSSSCMIMNNADNGTVGEIDDIIIGSYDMSLGYEKVEMTFYVGYTKFNDGSADMLKVLVSDDCGKTWQEEWMKTHTDLETAVIAQASSNAWEPSTDEDWRKETVDLSAYSGNNVQVKFQNVSGFGTRIWIDKINLDGVLSASIIDRTNFSVAPNPASNQVNLQFGDLVKGEAVLSVRNILSQEVISKTLNVYDSNANFSLDVSNLRSGMYVFEIRTASSRFIQKVIVD